MDPWKSLIGLGSWEQSKEHEAYWLQLTAGNDLFRVLREAVRDRRLSEVKSRLAHAPGFIRESPDWAMAQILLACAEIAALDDRDAERLPALLRKLDPQADFPAAISTLAGSLQKDSRHDWRRHLRRWIDNLHWPEWPSPQCAAWAWDAISAFQGKPRPVERRERIIALLVERVFQDGRRTDDKGLVRLPGPAVLTGTLGSSPSAYAGYPIRYKDLAVFVRPSGAGDEPAAPVDARTLGARS